MSEQRVRPFDMKVEEIFRFTDGATVFVGAVIEDKRISYPYKVNVTLDGVPIAKISLVGERMPGPKLSPKHLVVYTYDDFEIDLSIEKKRYALISRIDNQARGVHKNDF